MKNFTYTARNESGALIRGDLKAADRISVLAQLRSRRLVPISVEEGKANPASGKSELKFKRSALVLVGVAVAMVGVWVALRLMRASETAAPKRKVPTEKVQNVAKPDPAPTTKAVPEKPVAPSKPPTFEPSQPPVEVAAPHPAERPVIVPPKMNSLDLHLPPKGDRVLVPGIRRNADTNAPNPYATFQTKSERLMSQMLDTKPGEMIVDVSLGRDFDKDFASSLSNMIEIYPTDTPEMAAHKEEVAWMKEEIRKLAKEGQSPEEILTTFRNEHNAVAKFRSDLQRELSELKKEGKAAEAEAFAEEANKMLEPYGTRPLTAFPVIKIKKPKN